MEKSLPAVSRGITALQRVLVLASASSFFAFVGGGQAAAAEALAPPPDAQVMTSGELYMLYRDKSWQWSGGAGRMQSDGRRFTAWAGSGEQATWAEGRWTVNDDGRLCFKAQWHSSSGIAPAKTCFTHKRVGGTIYQRREPAQAWYVFKHSKIAEGDEFNKLVTRDLVSAYLNKVVPKSETPRPEIKINWSKQP